MKVIQPSFIFLIFVCVLFSVQSASALDEMKNAKLNEEYTILQVCSDATYINFTVSNLEGIPLSNVEMINNGSGNWFYPFTPTVTGRHDFTGISDGCEHTFAAYFLVSTTGSPANPVQISIYIIFLLLCFVIIFFSGRLAMNNSFEKDKIDFKSMYEEKKRKESSFYLKLVKRKMWILGTFGVYLFTLLSIAFLSQIVYNLDLQDLYSVFSSLVTIGLWGLIPFIIFWIIYIILFFYKSTEEAMRYQFGGFTR